MKAPLKTSMRGYNKEVNPRQTEDRMHADDIGKECGPKHQENNERHETLRRSIVNRTGLDGDPQNQSLYQKEQEQCPPDASQKDP